MVRISTNRPLLSIHAQSRYICQECRHRASQDASRSRATNHAIPSLSRLGREHDINFTHRVFQGSDRNARALARFHPSRSRAWPHLQHGKAVFSTIHPIVDPKQHARGYASHASIESNTVNDIAFSTPISRLEVGPGKSAKIEPLSNAREQFRQWQETIGKYISIKEIDAGEDTPSDSYEPTNRAYLRPDKDTFYNDASNEDAMIADDLSRSANDVESDSLRHPRNFFMGDLLEVQVSNAGNDNLLVVFVRTLPDCTMQVLSIHGKWIQIRADQVRWCSPKFINARKVNPLLEHLPYPKTMVESEQLKTEAYLYDLQVPREITAGIVARLTRFHAEVMSIYRENVNRLDSAHDILSHDSDLRYGSMPAVAASLLRIPVASLTPIHLYAARIAIIRAGFAFNIDTRSHHVTGYLQIRSKDVVDHAATIRNMFHEWQDDRAIRARLPPALLAKHKTKLNAQEIYDFTNRARKIINRSRSDRQPSSGNIGNIGPSHKYHSLAEHDSCLKHSSVEADSLTSSDHTLIRFIESWALNHTYKGVPYLESLPPLLLQATGLYPEENLTMSMGIQFLQELGVISPHENRAKHDPHLLLPSSNLSKPLKTLADTVEKDVDMQMIDTLAEIRHDWRNLPVYCIDSPGALEIDDGISLEHCSDGLDGLDQYWVHIHVANPTAFFDQQSNVARLARHLGETVYMPDIVTRMLPRWATDTHLSLGAGRPCITFSARIQDDGAVMEHKVTAGIVRNVLTLSRDEINAILGCEDRSPTKIVKLTAGGAQPARADSGSSFSKVMQKESEELKILSRIASARIDNRKRAGTLPMSMHFPLVNVWDGQSDIGLITSTPSNHDQPRFTSGDVGIQLTTREMTNWFASKNDLADVLVTEMMITACYVASKWCAERQIPIIHRSTMQLDTSVDPKQMFEESILPNMESDGSCPMHLGLTYVGALGTSTLSTRPRRHAGIGVDFYSKATSPLRRFGDMVAHWQIQAALLQEASNGRSLVVSDGQSNRKEKLDRSFLPFSATTLQAMIPGLHAREMTVSFGKYRAETFWLMMLIFRKFHYPNHETSRGPRSGVHGLPDTEMDDGSWPLPVMHAYISADPARAGADQALRVMLKELSMPAYMQSTTSAGLGLCQHGDTWEVKVDFVNVYDRTLSVSPVRLVDRFGG